MLCYKCGGIGHKRSDHRKMMMKIEKVEKKELEKKLEKDEMRDEKREIMREEKKI